MLFVGLKVIHLICCSNLHFLKFCAFGGSVLGSDVPEPEPDLYEPEPMVRSKVQEKE